MKGRIGTVNLRKQLTTPNTTSVAESLRQVSNRFIEAEISSGLLLLLCTIAAMVWANSPWSTGYTTLWESHLSINLAGLSLDRSLHYWVNDGLMVLFFLLVGLEIKREILVGELAGWRKALLPMTAALGGAVVPAVIYVIFNRGGTGASGWAIPMATDIAFALGVLSLLGSHVPLALRVFLTALAIADDLLAVTTITLFYSKSINSSALIAAGVILILLIACNRLGVRLLWIYALLGFLLWLAVFLSGIHATVAGVILAFTIPVRSRIDAQTFLKTNQQLIDEFTQGQAPGTGLVMDSRQQNAVRDLETACEQLQAPLQRIEHGLHIPVSYLIIPIFILSNAGVTLSPDTLTTTAFSSVSIGIFLGLIFGKQLGITFFTWLLVKMGWAALPSGITMKHVYGASWLGAIGFTMSLFIAELAFGDTQVEILNQAKVGILIALFVAGGGGYLVLRLLARNETVTSSFSNNSPETLKRQ